MPVKASGWRSRHRVLLGSATAAATAALIAVGVPALALSTHPTSTAGSLSGSGDPPPAQSDPWDCQSSPKGRPSQPLPWRR